MSGKSSIIILYVSLFVSGILILPGVVAADVHGAVVKIIPASVDTSAGDEFTVDIVVDPTGHEVFGVQYDLHFDPAVLEALTQKEGVFLRQDGAKTFEAANMIKNEDGLLEYGVSRMQVTEGVKESGTLATVTFRVIGEGGSKLELVNVKLSNPHAEVIPSRAEGGICAVEGVTPTFTSIPPSPSVSTETPATTATPDAPGFDSFSIIASLGILVIAYAFKRGF